MHAIATHLEDGPFGNPDTMISPSGLSLHKNPRLEEARDICMAILGGESPMKTAEDTRDLMSYAVGSMIAKLAKNGLATSPYVAFADLGKVFSPSRLEGDSAYRFSRRTVFETLSNRHMIQASTTIRDAKMAGTMPQVSEIGRVVESYTKIPLSQIQSPARSRKIVAARFITIWVMRTVCGHSLTHIGDQLGGRDHTSVLNGVNRIRELRAGDVAKRTLIDDICDEADMLAVRRQHSVLVRQGNLKAVT